MAALILGMCLLPDGLAASTTRQRPQARSRARKARRTQRQPANPVDARSVNDPSVHPDIKPKSAGSAVVRAQILLDRAHFSPGQIDGRWGDNLGVAIEGFQAAHHLPTSGWIDQE